MMGFIVLVLILSLLLQLPHSSNSLDTLTFDNPLKDDGSFIVSGGRIFALGFFSPGKSTNRYIGIWYLFSNQTVVWVANRDNPLPDSSGVLSFDGKGNLVLFSSSSPGSNLSNPVWSTNVSTSTAGNGFSGQLLDTGNLKLIHDGIIVWQSFDHPTHTWLPLMKLGLDRNTGLNRFLTSWKSEDDPGTGDFEYRMDDIAELPELIFQRVSTKNRIWRTGPWIGGGWVGTPFLVPGTFIFTTSFTNNENEVTVTYSMLNDSIFTRLLANESGFLQRPTWKDSDGQWFPFWTSQKEQCDQYNLCGPNGICDPQITWSSFKCKCLPGFEPKSSIDWDTVRDGSGGCVRKRGRPVCGEADGFIKVENAKSPDTRVARLNRTMGSVEACKEQCLNNCTCRAYASGPGDPNQCITWHGELLDIRVVQGGGQDLFVRIDPIEYAAYLKSHRSRYRMTYIIVAGTLIALAIGVAIMVYWCIMVKRRKERKIKERQMLLTPADGSWLEPSRTGNHFEDFPFFDLSTIVAATNNFSISNKLGQGGFGKVYKGCLKDGLEIAVKRLAKSSDQGVEEFKNEVSLIAKLQHKNLVRLLGCCVEQDEKILVYEYLPNKGLDSFIFNEERGSQLNWEKRFNIILGIAKGMTYLHIDSRLRIIHRDLKASNVLLDAELNPKISDFGMARIFRGGQMEVINTRRIVGTLGYMSPEYAMGGFYSFRSDVFSFGVLLLEIISGRKNNSYYQENTINLIGHVWDLWTEGNVFDVIDSAMGDSWLEEQVLRCFHIGLLCVQEHTMDRPTMSEVVFMLSKDMSLSSPKPPAFIFKGQDMNNLSNSSASSKVINSNNQLTITDIIAR